MNAQQIHYLNHGVVAIGRQEMNCAFLAQCLVADVLQLFYRKRLGYTDLCSKVGNTIDRSVPNNIFDVDVVADKHFVVVVYVDDAYESVALHPEIVAER